MSSYLQEKGVKAIEGYTKAYEQLGSELRKAQLINWDDLDEEKMLQMLPVLDIIEKNSNYLGLHLVTLVIVDSLTKEKP